MRNLKLQKTDDLEQEQDCNDVEYSIISIPEEDLAIEDDITNISLQPAVYISGYLASRLPKKNTCEKCIENLKVANPSDHILSYQYIQLREWWQDKQSLT